MAIRDKDTLKTFFEDRDFPTQNHFADLIDSLKHQDYTFGFSDQDLLLMVNAIANIDIPFLVYYIEGIGDSTIMLEAASPNAESQAIEIQNTYGDASKQYLLGDSPHTVKMKEFPMQELGPTEYYSLSFMEGNRMTTTKLFGNTLPNLQSGTELGVVNGRDSLLMVSKVDVGDRLKIVHSNIIFNNTSGVNIEYKAESAYWNGGYKTEDSITDHFSSWDYLHFYYNIDTTIQFVIQCDLYDLDTGTLIQSTYWTPGLPSRNISGGSVSQARNIRIECFANWH